MSANRRTQEQQQKLFNNVDNAEQRSVFDMSFSNKFTANFGKMIPTLCKEIIPHDHCTLKSSFFSRFLPLQAPVFQKLDFKINSFYVPNELIWKGWSQFFGDGDGQSADYLLSDHTLLASSEVPYFTTKDFADLMGLRFLKDSRGQDVQVINEWFTYRPSLYTESADKQKWRYSIISHYQGFTCCYVPFLFVTHCVDGVPSIENSNHTARRFALMLCKNSDYLSEMLEKGYILSAHDCADHDFYNWMNSKAVSMQVDSPACFVYDGFKLSDYMAIEYTMLTAPLDWIPMSYGTIGIYSDDIEIDSGGDFFGDNFSFKINGPAWFEYHYDRTGDPLLADCFSFNVEDGLPDNNRRFDDAFGRGLCGNPFVLLASDFNNDYSIGRISEGYLTYYMQYAQVLIKSYFGHCTLADYLGYSFTQMGYRQDADYDVNANIPGQEFSNHNGSFESASYIYNYRNKSVAFDGDTYDGVSDLSDAGAMLKREPYLIEVGIINDVPINILPFLAYKKCWNDYIRDPRYELRDPYCDPYRSPFLIPLSDGTYVNGNLLQKYMDLSMFNLEVENINHSCIFTYESIFSFFSLRERRVVQDYFTLMSPNSQFGQEVTVDMTSKQMDVVQGFTPTASQQLYRFPDGSFGSGANVRYGISSSFGIRALRLLGRLQKFMEQKNFYGSDYLKEVLADYGVEPEHCQHCAVTYLGGFRATPSLDPVSVTSTNGENGQVTAQQAGQFDLSKELPATSFFAKEHGYVIQMLSIMNDFAVTTGVSRQRITKYDYAIPQFANLSPEMVPYYRVMFSDALDDSYSVRPDSVFGYQPRYADYKCSLDEVHGKFKDSLSYFVATRQFGCNALYGTIGFGDSRNNVQLGKAFLYEQPNYQSFAYTSEDEHHVMLDFMHELTITRPLPVLPNPTIV